MSRKRTPRKRKLIAVAPAIKPIDFEMPHEKYGVDVSKVPDYIEPFTAYRVWQWDAEGVKSLNNAKWTPGVAFEATCSYTGGLSPAPWQSKADYDEQQKELQGKYGHHVPDKDCTCGMYAGINLEHLISIGYAQQGIHGEVSLWGKLERCSLGWRAQYAYPKFFIVPSNMFPWQMRDVVDRMRTLTAFGVDIFIQPDEETRVDSAKIPLYVKDYGWSQQGLGYLMDDPKRVDWYKLPKVPPPPLKQGDRVSIRDKGIGIVERVDGDEIYYSLWNTKVFRQTRDEFVWCKQSWRWECDMMGALCGANWRHTLKYPL